MHNDQRGRAEPGEPADAVPARGQSGLGEFEQGAAVDRRQVDAATTFEFAPGVMPVGAVQRVWTAEVLRPGYVRMDQLTRRLHGRGRELAGDREGAGRRERVLDGVFVRLGVAAATR